MQISKKHGSVVRKLKTIFLSVFYGSVIQTNYLLYSAIAVFLFSKEHWGEYSRIIISLSFFQTIANWGSREFMATLPSPSFREGMARNMTGRLFILIPEAFLVLLFLDQHPILAVTLLFAKFFTASFDVLVVKERHFTGIIFVEVALLLLYLISAFASKDLLRSNSAYFVLLMTGVEVFRTLSYQLVLKLRCWSWPGFKTIYSDIKTAFPFFGNALVGFLSSRIDSLVAVFYLGNAALAVYQVSFNFVLLFQSLANLIFYTYVFHFKRAGLAAKKRIILKNTSLGLFMTIAFFLLMLFVCRPLYQLDFDLTAYLLLALMVLLGFCQVPYIYLLYQNNKAASIVLFGGLSVLAFAAFLYLFSLFNSSLNFYSFLFSAVSAQLIRSALFILTGRKFLRENQSPAPGQ